MACRGPDARSVRRAVLTMAPPAPTGREVGPARGALPLSGGGGTASQIIDRFIEPAGGPDAPIVVGPTSGRPDEDYHVFRPCPRRFREGGERQTWQSHTPGTGQPPTPRRSSSRCGEPAAFGSTEEITGFTPTLLSVPGSMRTSIRFSIAGGEEDRPGVIFRRRS